MRWPIRSDHRQHEERHDIMATAEYHPTKYDSARDEVIALLADEAEGYGERDDTSGNVNAPGGWFALVTIPAGIVWSPAADFTGSADDVASEYGVTKEDIVGTHIVTHDSQGFVSVETFDSAKEAREAFDCRAARFAAWDEHEDTCAETHLSGPDDECDWDGIYICPVTGHGYHSL
jgi:hypothetical protein